jgi:hypothetical protein
MTVRDRAVVTSGEATEATQALRGGAQRSSEGVWRYR